MDKKHLPLEFQKLNETKKTKIDLNNKIRFTESGFYNTILHKPESFYKPISKIFKFDE